MTPRPLSSDQLHATGLRLQAIATELLADHAPTVQRNLAAAADPTPWPTSTGGAGNGTTSGSPVEQAIGLNRTDDRPMIATPPMTTRAARLLDALHAIMGLAVTVDHGLHEWSPNRTIAYCPNPTCGRAIPLGGRCPTCSTRQQAKPTCHDCGTEEPGRDGFRFWPSAQAPDKIQLCRADWMFRHRHEGRARVGVERLALAANMIEQESA